MIMYIYPSSPESQSFLQSEESAAIKIQANFRGYRVRKQLIRLTKSNSVQFKGYLTQRFSSHSHNSSIRRQQRQQRQQHITEFMEDKQKKHPAATFADGKQQNDVTADATSVEDRCATKIQAGVRGFLVRKKQKQATNAAVKIQSSFRGFKARKEAEKLKQT